MPPRSIVVSPETPSNQLAFVLPPNVTLSVQSVFAAIDASGAGDVTATIEVADSSGAVIARKRQGEVIDAGTPNGSATWALRLGDEGTRGGASLATTDGTTTVSPTSLLSFLNGQRVVQTAPGAAVVIPPPVTAYASGHWNAAANTNGVARPLFANLQRELLRGFTIFGGTDLIVPFDGYYVFFFDGEVTQPGAAPAGVPLTITMTGLVYGSQAIAVVPNDAAIAGGGAVSRRLSATGTCFIPGTEHIQIMVGNQGAAAPNTTTAGGTFGIFRVFS